MSKFDHKKIAGSIASRKVGALFGMEKAQNVLFVGDIMLDRRVEDKILTEGGGDYRYPFAKIQPVLQSADLVFGNLEGSLSDVGDEVGNEHSFRFPLEARHALAWAGFDVLSLANNHMMDWGYPSLNATPSNLHEVGIGTVGAGTNKEEAERAHIEILSDGTSVGFLAFSEFEPEHEAREGSPGLSEWDELNMERQVRSLVRMGIDVIAVSMHWGVEYANRSEDFQQKLGRRLVNAGADLVIGHHPHVSQEVVRDNGGWTIYSLGNFVFDQDWSKDTMESYIANVQIKAGKVLGVTLIPIQVNKNFQPELA